MTNFEFFQRGIVFEQSDALFRLGTDAIVLADFAPNVKRVCDLCAGTGAVGLLLCSKDAFTNVTAVELQAQAFALLKKNIAANALDARFTAIEGDIRQIRTLLAANSFDAVVCNPPYFPVGSGFVARGEAFELARTERCCTITDVCAAAAWLLQSGGCFSLVHRPERLTDILCALRAHRLEPKQIRFVRNRPCDAVSLVLIRSVLDGKPGLSYDADLLLANSDGTPSEAYRRIYHGKEDV